MRLASRVIITNAFKLEIIASVFILLDYNIKKIFKSFITRLKVLITKYTLRKRYLKL